MTGLNLERFLHLLRADLGAWATLGLIAGVLALMAWTSWGSRKALRKCLVLSVVAHFGLALYGGTVPVVLLAIQLDNPNARDPQRIRQIKVAPLVEPDREGGSEADEGSGQGRSGGKIAAFDRTFNGLALADTKRDVPERDPAKAVPMGPADRVALTAEPASPEAKTPAPAAPEARVAPSPSPETAENAPGQVKPGNDDVAPPVLNTASTPVSDTNPVAGRLRPERTPSSATVPANTRSASVLPALPDAPPVRLSPPSVANLPEPGPLVERAAVGSRAGGDLTTAKPTPLGETDVASVVVEKTPVAPLPRVAPPESDVRRLSRPSPTTPTAPDARRSLPIGELALSRVTPTGVPALPDIQGAAGGRPLNDVPEVYRSRLDPNRIARAYRAGASPASEQAVERALDWLARHQDADGRWDGATAHYDDGTTVKGDDDFTVHCPPGEPCFGECIYWEADTALTGLALLAYLGSGYTHTDGKYSESVGKGLDFLILSQKPDGDLRGKSRAVGMYCHAMATIALCEAFALTGDERLREPVERAVGFLVRSRARDGLSWRYAPGEQVGDTSILGWVVMALKSAKEVGITVPSQIQTGTLGWLNKVSSGDANGLARYQPADKVTPTMTAEAWVCRQFLGVGGPGPASSEAAAYLLSHGPKSGVYNLYYWYYGTLAMYQHGGPAWTRWNSEVRDEIVRRQRPQGHAAGSWDPDDSAYGSRGGRIYCTAMATLSLEVYYRYLRLYDDPKIPPAVAPARPRNSERAPDRLGGSVTPSTRVGANR